jgi:hypothetical protein
MLVWYETHPISYQTIMLSYTNATSDRKFFEVDDSAFDYFEELIEITVASSGVRWTRAVVTLSRSGKFIVDYS